MTVREARIEGLGLSRHGRGSWHQVLEDAGIAFDKIEQAAVGYCYGDSTAGRYLQPRHDRHPDLQRTTTARRPTALFMAKQFVAAGIADCALALASRRWRRARWG
jgi:sterol carrier protein 2